jgi:uncharacterized protein (UPF0332 family)
VSCQPENFLTLATKLAPSKEEIERRCAVSRAYYAAFHWARELVTKCPPIDFGAEKVGSHERVLRRLRAYRESKDALKAAYILADLKTKREGADYDLTGDVTAEDASQALMIAERVKALLETMPQWKPA